MSYGLITSPGKKPFLSKWIQGCAARRRLGCGGVHPPTDIHKKNRISVAIDVLNNTLNFFRSQAVGFDPPFHHPPFRNSDRRRGIRTSPWHYLFFFGRRPEFPGLSFAVWHSMIFVAQRAGGIMRTRVLLADDHVLFAEALSHLLAQRYDVVDVVGDGRALLASTRNHKPDVVVVDITMPLMSGLESVRTLGKDSYTPKIVFLTMHTDSELARECFHCGGSAFVSKDSGYDELSVAIDTVMADQLYLSPNVAGGVIDLLRDPGTAAAPIDLLTPRQREILQLFAEGKTMKEIASLTNLSTRTVEWHKYRMMRTLRVRRSAELVQHAVRMKMVA
jgi:DNA-binding NarL/FixJ family response regulator